jgi:gliding motility-associated-like protein
MKKVLFCLILLLAIVASSKAQFEHNKKGEITPFSLSEKYKHLFDVSKTKTLELPSYNNDSLFWEANFESWYIQNKPRNIVSDNHIIKKNINFKKLAQSYELDNGTVWLLKIESQTAEALSVFFEEFEFPDGALFSYYSKETELEPFVRTKSGWDGEQRATRYWKHARSNNMIIEYFEPNGISLTPNIKISKINYHFYSVKKKITSKTLPNHLKKSIPTSTLKKAALGDDCQFDINCSGVPDYKEESNAVCFFDILYDDIYLGIQHRLATGVFINKGGNYSETDKPYILTAGHSFYIPNSKVPIDFGTGYEYMSIYIKKQNKGCNVPYEYTVGTLMPNSTQFKVVKLGSSYDNEVDNSSYVANQDYAILQAPGMVKDYAQHKILYAGWASIVYYSQKNWVSIGHPEGSPQKIFVDEGEALDGDTYFGLFFDKGLSRPGTSGAPVFNAKRQVVGWICSGDINNTCANVGTNNLQNLTKCGELRDIHYEISQYIDPNFLYVASAYTAPIPGVPDHCKNCVQDADKGETDIDCGGPCLPCGIAEKKTINSMSDISKKVRARYQLEVSPVSGQNITLKGGTYNFTAGEEIQFNNGFILQDGVDFEAKVDENLKSEPEQGCQKVCLYLPNAFTPNGDGLNDVWGFNQAYMVSYRINIWDRNNKTWFQCGNRPLSENGFVPVWDGKGAPNDVYYGSINYTDCYGVERNQTFFIHIFGSSNKAAAVNNKSGKLPDTEVVNDSFSLLPDLNVYPNPTNGKVMIDYSSPEGKYEYTILNQSGKTIIQNCGKR